MLRQRPLQDAEVLVRPATPERARIVLELVAMRVRTLGWGAALYGSTLDRAGRDVDILLAPMRAGAAGDQEVIDSLRRIGLEIQVEDGNAVAHGVVGVLCDLAVDLTLVRRPAC